MREPLSQPRKKAGPEGSGPALVMDGPAQVWQERLFLPGAVIRT
jgi:hypothetical protein